MNWLRRALATMSNIVRRDRMEQELEQEVRSYAEMLSDENVSRGMKPEEARRAAQIEMGGVEQLKEEVRSRRAGARIETIWRDLRYGARMLYKNAGFTAAALLTLALGIGANSAIFSVLNASLLASMPIPSGERAVMVWTDNVTRGWSGLPASAGDYLDWKASGIFKSLAAFDSEDLNVRMGDRTERLEGLSTTPEWFGVQEVKPYLGRLLNALDMHPGHDRVAVLGYSLWNSRFSRDPRVVGSTLVVNSRPYTIVGVTPDHILQFQHEVLYTPLAFDAAEIADRGTRSRIVMGRLADGLTLAAAQQRITALSSRLARQYSQNAGCAVRLQPAREAYVEDVQALVLLLVCAVGFVLLVACANIANLLLVRGTARLKEMAVRGALGASRIRLASQLISESVLLACIGGAVGILPAWGGIQLIASFQLQDLPRPELLRLDGSVLVFTFVLSLITGILFGLAPVWQLWRTDINEPLKQNQRSHSAGSQRRLSRIFIAGQFAVTVILLTGAGLALRLRSFLYLRSSNPGFDTSHVFSMNISLSGPSYDSPEKQTEFYKKVVDRLDTIPGVRCAGATNLLPGSDDLHGSGIHFEGRPDPKPNEIPIVLVGSVTPDYFRAMQIPILRGRGFDERDRTNAPLSVIIDEDAAAKFWKGEDPLGKRIRLHHDEPFRQIVGIAGNVEQGLVVRLAKGRVAQVYLPFAQVPQPDVSLVISSRIEPAALIEPAKAAIRAIDPNQPAFRIQTLAEARAKDRTPARIAVVLLGFFACLALLLASVGIYGVIAYTVAQRTREIGIRMALGATKRDLLKLVLGNGGLLIFVGAAVGLAGALGLTRLMGSLLSGIGPNDPLTFAAVTLLLVAVGLTASYVPARRASRVDPTVALKYE